MKLLSIKLFNFRQFYGETPEIELSGAENKKVTVFHGNNGSGKTTLLNAFTWVLYDCFTTAFKAQESLVNKRAIAEAKNGTGITCWVKLTFEHGGKRYILSRSREAFKLNEAIEETPGSLNMMVLETNGKWITPEKPGEIVNIVNRVLPRSLHHYFFFDGERIEKIVESNKKDEISAAAKTLIGLEVIDRSITHLTTVRRDLQKNLKDVGDSETKILISRKESLEDDLKKIEVRQGEIEDELSRHKTLRDEIEQRLRKIEGAKDKQDLRDNLESQMKTERLQIEKSQQAIKKAIASLSYTVFLSDATLAFRRLVDDLRERGELPSDIKETFIDDLLERGECICGSKLHQGSSAFARVTAYRNKAGMPDVETKIIEMVPQINGFSNKTQEFWEKIKEEKGNIDRLNQSINNIENELFEIGEILSNSPNEDIQRLNQRRAEEISAISNLDIEKGEKNHEHKQKEAEIKKAQQEMEKHQLFEERQILAQRRVRAAEEAVECLQKIRENYSNLFRSQLEKKIQKIFSDISITPYTPRLNENYELTLEDNTAGRSTLVAASQGESQVLSLSFIGAVIAKVREWSQKKSVIITAPDVGSFPLVMDSPFGALDSHHRQEVARSIPKLANQVIVLASKTQWREEVEKAMRLNINKMYVLLYHSPKDDLPEDTILLNSKEYPLVQRSQSELEWTEIIEVS
jgi:DNA sulfur modification protein DndD